MREYDLENLRISFSLARSARKKGNHPFGALLVSSTGEILLEIENTVNTEKDVTAHAETNLIRQAFRIYSSEYLIECTLYASTEPCPMCAGAIYWGNIGRVVFGLSEERFYKECIPGSSKDSLLLPCRDVFSRGKKEIEVLGPLLEDEAVAVHEGFW